LSEIKKSVAKIFGALMVRTEKEIFGVVLGSEFK
jgi:hypothetical protein